MGEREKRLSRWYFGGLAAAAATCLTHPLDLLKVQLQTQQKEKISLAQLTSDIVKKHGVFALYSGISAAIVRQLTYSTTRFAIYEVAKQSLASTGTDVGFAERVAIAAFAGAVGGFIGTPADMVNVRMQNDMKLPPDKRRNYKNVFDGFYKVIQDEGPNNLLKGAGPTCVRAALMTIGQLTFYDQFKMMFLATGYFEDNIKTHFLASLSAGTVATLLTQPLDVLKTRAMSARPGQYSGMMDIVKYTAKSGPLAFYKGIVPAFMRVGPMTILVFLILEQLRLNFGIDPVKKEE